MAVAVDVATGAGGSGEAGDIGRPVVSTAKPTTATATIAVPARSHGRRLADAGVTAGRRRRSRGSAVGASATLAGSAVGRRG
ncbi:MAG TPA: hypothetical protein VG078_03070, partial [Acidimicrobiales bacterium]|nr:hypothetical protein [Acidimicrobiales bacterium]